MKFFQWLCSVFLSTTLVMNSNCTNDHPKEMSLWEKNQKDVKQLSSLSSKSSPDQHHPYLCTHMLLDIVHLFEQQHHNSVQYRRLCTFDFVHLFRWWPQSSDVLLYGSIMNRFDPFNPWNDTGTIIELRFPRRIFFGHLHEMPSLSYRVVIRFEVDHHLNVTNNNTFEVDVNNRKFSIPLRQGNVFEYMLPVTFNYSQLNYHTLMMKIPRNSSHFIGNSYVAICLNPFYSNANCTFKVEGQSIACYCVYNHKGPIFTALTLALLWTVLLLNLLYYNWWTVVRYEPEVQFNLILCISGNSTHDYLVILRVGPATNGFNYEDSYLDVLLHEDGDHPIGSPLRYACSNLPQSKIGELHLVIGRISPQIPITAVTINHSDQQNVMFLQDFTLIDLNGEKQVVMQQERLDKLITSEQTIFHVDRIMRRSGKNESKQTSFANTNKQMTQPMRSTQKQLLADLAQSLDLTDKIAIAGFVLGFVSALTMAARVYFHHAFWKEFANSVSEFLVWMFIVAASCWAIIVVVRKVYLSWIKKNYQIEAFSTEQWSTFCWLRLALLLCLHLLGLVMSATTIYFSSSLDHVGFFLWSGMFFSTVALTLGVWLFVEDSVHAYGRAKRAKHDFMEQLFGRAESNTEQRPVLCASSTTAVTVFSRSSYFGPKMTNPNNIPRHISSYVRFMNMRDTMPEKSNSERTVSHLELKKVTSQQSESTTNKRIESNTCSLDKAPQTSLPSKVSSNVANSGITLIHSRPSTQSIVQNGKLEHKLALIKVKKDVSKSVAVTTKQTKN